MRSVIEGCAIATVDAAGTEHRDGHIVIEGDRIVAVGEGPRHPSGDARRIDGRGCLATPGLVNCHHHLYQWATRGLAQQATLFEWLVELYPMWAHVDADVERRGRARRAGRARALGLLDLDRSPLRLPGAAPATCSRSRSRRRAGSACAFTRAAGRWTSGSPPAACRPTRWSRTATRSSPPARPPSTASTTPRPGRWCAIALAPCSPFSVTPELMAETARARAPPRRAPAHPPGRDARRGGLLPGALRRASRRSTWRISAGWATTCGSRTACT